MKTLTGHLFLYDKDCPLCCWYTNLFVKYKVLDESGRISFQDIDREKYSTIDYYTAQNKIALVNTDSGQVTYGIDAITTILSIPFPLIGTLMKFRPLHWLMEMLYMLISMNRKIIIPVSCSKTGSCTPSRSWTWRIIFIIFCCLVVNLLVGNYFHRHLADYFIGNTVFSDTLFFVGQLAFQYIACLVFKEKNIYDYLGQVSVVSLLGAFILAFMGLGLDVLNYFQLNLGLLRPFCYGAVFAWMFMEHRRRIRIAEMDPRLTYSWLLYRILLYPFAFTI